jgi:integrase
MGLLITRIAKERSMRLTKGFVDKQELSIDAKVVIHWDSEVKGYGIKISKTKKVYIAQAKIKGRSKRVTIGTHGKITEDQARTMAKKVLVTMLNGIDPNTEKRKEKVQNISLEQVVKSYLLSKKLKPLSVKNINTHLNFNFTEWKNKPLSRLTRTRVKKKFMKISKRSPAQANQAMRVLRALWNYAVAEYRYPDDTPVFGENPVNILSEQQIWNTIRPRNSKVPINKVGTAWNVIKDLRDSPVKNFAGSTIIDATAFIFLTGCRLDEATALTWDRVNINEGWWHLDDPKNGRAITFPLSEIACKIIANRPRTNEFVFASKGKYGHITEVRTPMKKISKAIKLKVTAHDLRRTFKAIAIENRIELWKVNLLTNHQESGVAIKHYVETSDLLYFRLEVNTIAEWILNQAKIVKIENIINISERKQVS